MLKNLSMTVAMCMVSAVIFLGAQARSEQSHSKVVTPTLQASPASGARMYASYCASCHGISGKGDGPSAAALKTRPADLTVLSKQNGGKFPESHVMSVLRFGSVIASHGSQEMPIWGPALGKMDQSNKQETQLRISNLSRYLETIQAK